MPGLIKFLGLKAAQKGGIFEIITNLSELLGETLNGKADL